MPAWSARPGRRWRAGSRADAMPARCTTRRKILLRISWRNVVCAARARDEHRNAWSTLLLLRAATGAHLHALHGGGVKGQHAGAQAVAEAAPDLPTLQSHGSVEGEGVQPRRCMAAGNPSSCCGPCHGTILEKCKAPTKMQPCLQTGDTSHFFSESFKRV
jgi:hypothetical protein